MKSWTALNINEFILFDMFGTVVSYELYVSRKGDQGTHVYVRVHCLHVNGFWPFPTAAFP